MASKRKLKRVRGSGYYQKIYKSKLEIPNQDKIEMRNIKK